ncbi:MAG: hypothetical protein AB7W28_11325, partial [Armatimonadota bacterium]
TRLRAREELRAGQQRAALMDELLFRKLPEASQELIRFACTRMVHSYKPVLTRIFLDVLPVEPLGGHGAQAQSSKGRLDRIGRPQRARCSLGKRRVTIRFQSWSAAARRLAPPQKLRHCLLQHRLERLLHLASDPLLQPFPGFFPHCAFRDTFSWW